MKKAVIAVALVLIFGGCSPKFILPEDTRVVAPPSGGSKTLLNYSGTWEGNCGEEDCRIVVEAVEPPKVTAVYAWGRFKRP